MLSFPEKKKGENCFLVNLEAISPVTIVSSEIKGLEDRGEILEEMWVL